MLEIAGSLREPAGDVRSRTHFTLRVPSGAGALTSQSFVASMRPLALDQCADLVPRTHAQFANDSVHMVFYRAHA